MDREREQGTRANLGFARAEWREVAASGARGWGGAARTARPVGFGRRLGVVTWAVVAAAAVGLAPLAASPRAAFAGEAKPAAAGAPAPEALAAYTAAELQVKVHLRDKAYDALVKDVGDLSKTASGLTDVKLQAKYRALVGSICQGCNEDAVQKACLKALGESKDPDMFRYVRPFLAQPNVKETPPLLDDAITAASKLVADDAVGPLLKLVQDSKVLPVAQAAMKALSTYGTSTRMRVQILKELAATVEKDQPGVGHKWDTTSGAPVVIGKTRSGEDAQARWGALAPELVKTLNTLTGQNCPSAEEWFRLIDKYKNNPGTLFGSK